MCNLPLLNIKYIKRGGFSLAEVILTLTIVGIIATLVIPPLIESTQNAQFLSGIKQSMSDLSGAVNLLKMNNAGSLAGLYTGVFTTNADQTMNAFCSQLNCIKQCTSGQGTCWHYDNMWYGLNKSPQAWGNRSAALLVNGEFVMFEYWSQNCTDVTVTTFPVCGTITVDLNGFNPPNTEGRDIFRFWLTSTNIIPMGVAGDFNNSNDSSSSCTTASGKRGDGCASKVLTENGINY